MTVAAALWTMSTGEVLQFSVRFTGQVPEATLTLSWHEPPHRKRRRQKLLEVRKPA